MSHSDPEKSRTLYNRIIARRWLYLTVGLGLLVLSVLINVGTGPSGMPVSRVVRAVFAPTTVDRSTWTIVWILRLPTALMALAVGASLASAGVEMQTILGNPLASPFTLGISAAAGFGAACALVLGVGLPGVSGTLLVPVNAFAVALLSSFVVYTIARARQASVGTIVLIGIALQSLFHSLLALLEFIATDEQLRAVVFWLFGSLEKATWSNTAIVWGAMLVIAPLFAMDAWKLTALRAGEAKAESLGVDIVRLRRKVLLLGALLTATATCFVGSIGFVGLVAPHIARLLVGEDQRFLLPLSALGGALLLSVASIVSKLIVPGAVFPVGVVTSFIGIPFFLSLILTRRNLHW